jgi:anti-anti-sigma factor
VIATVVGDLDRATAPQLAAILGRNGTVPPAGLLVLDLTGVTFIDTSGVYVVVDTHEKLGGSLRVIASRACILLLEALGLTDITAS